ncbi:hypothetical protein B0H19DRAFT_1078740 [Mycena capillaripes]|nr:hypothetical protein B0H19DRAFT_1078740 [Mycena capillaripes]
MSYSITVEWKQDKFYHYLDALRAGLGSFGTPVHISIASFLRVTDTGLPSLKHSLRTIASKRSAHDLVFGRMPHEPFGEKCVAVPINLSGELEKIWDEICAFCVGWSLKLPHPNFKPHATISMGKCNTKGIHDRARTSLQEWANRHGAMKAKAVGLDLWKHTEGKRDMPKVQVAPRQEISFNTTRGKNDCADGRLFAQRLRTYMTPPYDRYTEDEAKLQL